LVDTVDYILSYMYSFMLQLQHSTLEKTKGTINTGQSRENGNFGHRRHRSMTNNKATTTKIIKNIKKNKPKTNKSDKPTT